jgi:hypothetical protein
MVAGSEGDWWPWANIAGVALSGVAVAVVNRI